jgi:predicted nucleotidyltransferase
MSIRNREELEQRIIHIAMAGSRSFKVDIKGSDVDNIALCVPPRDYYYGVKDESRWLWLQEKHQDFSNTDTYYEYGYALDNTDTRVYTLDKFVELALKGNPQCLCFLWQPLEEAIYTHTTYSSYSHDGTVEEYLSCRLLDNLFSIKHAFLSKQVYSSFMGNALSHMSKGVQHTRWISEAPIKPNIDDYNLPPNLLRKDSKYFYELLVLLMQDAKQSHNLEECTEEIQYLITTTPFKSLLLQNGIPDSAMELVQHITYSSTEMMQHLSRLKQYMRALSTWNSYSAWLCSKKKYGTYDGKNLSYALLLYTMITEVLTTGNLEVDRDKAGDSELLRAIRYELLSYADVLDLCHKQSKQAIESYSNTQLPDSPDRITVNNVLVDTIHKAWEVLQDDY